VGCEPRTNELLAESLTDLAIWAGHMFVCSFVRLCLRWSLTLIGDCCNCTQFWHAAGMATKQRSATRDQSIHETVEIRPGVRKVISTVWIDDDIFSRLDFVGNLSK